MKEHLGHRFEPSADKRIKTILKLYEQLLTVPAGNEKKEKNLNTYNKILNYKTQIDPDKSYNARRSGSAYHRARHLTIEKMDDFLDATGWSNKQFLEFILEENSGFSEEDCLSPEKPEGWTSLHWPSKAMELIADKLDTGTQKEVDVISRYIDQLLPASYPAFLESLSQPSFEYGKDEQIPMYMQENPEEYQDESKAENMGDRILDTMFYLSDSKEIESICKENGITYSRETIKRINRPRHFWAFKISQLQKISDAFLLTPHWLFYGGEEKALIAKKAETELIMDKLQFLPIATQNEIAIAVTGKEMRRN